MLTVGFGDISASNHLEALCLIFIETFSCMVLAYNINCVGSLISNIRSQDLEKSKKYKIFRSLAEKNSISTELSLRIGNYIEESNNIKKKFNIEEENRFIDALPRIFKKDYLKEANKSIFQKIFFFTNLADKAVQALAESIEVSITHPEELIINVETYMSLKILKEGRMGYCCRKLGSKYNGYVIDQISVAEGEAPFLLGVEFITHRRPTFEIKAMEYSIIYGLAYDRLIQSLRKSRGDYEYFCFLRDKSKYLVDEF
jgi:potassium voltage-gated channel Eag-related subfamily H protein 5